MLKRKNIILFDDCYKSEEAYNDYHTLDLLKVLNLLRSERSDVYQSMQKMAKYRNEDVEHIEEIFLHNEEQYRIVTNQQRLVEGIIGNRVGYVPKRIDHQLLDRWEKRVDEYEEGVRKRAKF